MASWMRKNWTKPLIGGVHGEAAAALATIKSRRSRALAAKVRDFAETEGELAAEVEHGPVAELDVAQGEAKPFRFEAVFSKHLNGLAKINHRLFAGQEPNFALMHQGSIGDCFFFSVVGNLATAPARPNPADDHRRNRRGVSRPLLATAKKIKVPAPTDVEIIINRLQPTASKTASGSRCWRKPSAIGCGPSCFQSADREETDHQPRRIDPRMSSACSRVTRPT